MFRLIILMATTPVLHQQSIDNRAIYASLSSVYAKNINQVTPERLIKMCHIGLKTLHCTLKATIHQCIRNTGLLAKRFNIDKVQLRYKKLFRRHRIFYADYLNVGDNSVKGLIGGTLYQ